MNYYRFQKLSKEFAKKGKDEYETLNILKEISDSRKEDEHYMEYLNKITDILKKYGIKGIDADFLSMKIAGIIK